MFVCCLYAVDRSTFPISTSRYNQNTGIIEITESLLISDLNAKISQRSDPDTDGMLIPSVNNTSDYNQMITPADMFRTAKG